MPRYRFDLHVHTRVSPDGLDHAEAVVHAAREAGLDGIAITDHDRRGGYDRLVRLGLADPRGIAVDGFLVIPGVEVSCEEGHVLVLGAAWDVPARAAAPTAAQVVRRAHAENPAAVAAPAHPFDRLRSGIGLRTMERVRFDAIEAWNSKTIERRSNAAAVEYAARSSLPGIAGSDSHFAGTVGRAHTLVEAGELSVGAVLGAIRAGKTELVPGRHTGAEMVRYWARGWFTRPWLLDLGLRGVGKAGATLRRRATDRPAGRAAGPIAEFGAIGGGPSPLRGV